MDTKIKTGILIAFALLWATNGCRKKDLDPLPFFQINTEKGRILPSGSIALIARIKDAGGVPLDSCGIVWSGVEADVQNISGVLNILSKKPQVSQDTVAFQFTPPEPGQTYYFRAFGVMGSRKVYGIALSYTLGEIAALGELKPEVSNDSATVSGRLSGLSTLPNGLEEHGIVYSATNPMPERDAPDCQYLNLKEAFRDTLFEARLTGLSFNSLYYYRTYGRAGGRTWHSKKTATFEVTDGWRRQPDFISYQLGSSVVSGNRAYMGFGSKGIFPYLSSSLDNALYTFDPQTGWNTNLPPLAAQTRTEVALFALKDTVYTLMGGYLPADQTCAAFTLVDFQKIATNSSVWRKGTNPPLLRRVKAISFTANGKAYVGGGKIFVYDTTVPNADICPYRDSFLSDFWEYTPENGRWRQVASLPYRDFNNPQVFTGGRAEAVSFSDGAFGYVGGGVFESLYLRDLWRFVPPTGPADPGRWEFVTYLPGLPRVDATAFAINGKAFFGWGLDPFSGYLSDFWELELSNPLATWGERTPCPGPRRGNAYHFVLNGKAYLGGGINRVWDGFQGLNTLYFDFWEYTPVK